MSLPGPDKKPSITLLTEARVMLASLPGSPESPCSGTTAGGKAPALGVQYQRWGCSTSTGCTVPVQGVPGADLGVSAREEGGPVEGRQDLDFALQRPHVPQPAPIHAGAVAEGALFHDLPRTKERGAR